MLFNISLPLIMCCWGSTMFSWTRTSDFCFHQCGGETGTEHERKEQNKTSSSAYSFPLKWIPREYGKPQQDPTPAERAAVQQRDPRRSGSAGLWAAPCGEPWADRAARRLEWEPETDRGPTASGWAPRGVSNANRDKRGFLHFKWHTPACPNSRKGAPPTPATTWFKYTCDLPS